MRGALSLADQIAEDCAAGAADQVHEIGHIVLEEDGRVDLAAQIDDSHQNQCEGDGARPHPGQGGEHDEHEDDAAGPQQGAIGEEEALEHSGDEGGGQDTQEEGAAAILLLQRGPHHQEEHHVVCKVLPALMAKHMAEQADEEGGADAGAVNREEFPGGLSLGDQAQQEDSKGQQEKGEDYGGIIMQSLHGGTTPLQWGMSQPLYAIFRSGAMDL